MITFDWPRRKHNDAAIHAAAAPASPNATCGRATGNLTLKLDLGRPAASHGGANRGKHMIRREKAATAGDGGARSEILQRRLAAA